MNHTLSRFAASAACLAITLATQVAHADTLYIHAGRLLDVQRGKVLEDQRIAVDNQRIVAIETWSPPLAGSQVVDWSARTVLPGLIDMHTHIADWDMTSNVAEPLLHSPQAYALLGAKHAYQTLRAGFTSVHDVGTYRAFTDVALRDAINAGQDLGPRMNVVGAYISVAGGGGEVTGFAPGTKLPEDMRVGVYRDANDAKLKTRYLFQQGVDTIKMVGTGAVLAEGTEPGQMEMTEEEMRVVVQEAKVHKSYATVHAHGSDGIKAAIRAGVKSVEHASLIDDEGIALAKQHGTWLVMDIYNGDYIDKVGREEHWPEGYLRKNLETTQVQREGFRKAVKAGVKVAFGTDAGVYPHGQNARQFAYMVKYGMTPMQAIQAATVVAAELLNWQQDVGAVEVGRYADLIAVDGDPLADIALLEKTPQVMKGGKLVPADLLPVD
ncbi:imidazolonepropionase-like amidohydrolase [Pseudomonas nitritireducens]|uniref:Imidazolonepropionase-like amidohydrolase n=1 Tax=Pseudomonas nitroreducens TaxID=46680 RepID=A0A7W7KL90_PSENT|nr:amidohydrolase family protein [Pseudomonas nitritireducens]MBB4864880.1 imidazolonepropionase-like amidohydrolase [Pseudomonas nitritireducens]